MEREYRSFDEILAMTQAAGKREQDPDVLEVEPRGTPVLDSSQLAEIGKALAHPRRVEILELLLLMPVTSLDISVALEMGMSLVSYHVRQLEQAGLVRIERRGALHIHTLTERALALVAALS